MLYGVFILCFLLVFDLNSGSVVKKEHTLKETSNIFSY